MPRGRRALALFLTGVLSFEAAFGNGLSLAFAEPLDGGQTIIQTGDDDLQLVVGDNSGAQDPQDPGNGGPPSGTEEDTPHDWTNDTERLELTPGTLEIDCEALKALIEDANKDDQTEEDGTPAGDVATDDSVTAQSDDLAPEPELPEQLPAELGLSFTLDPAASTDSPEEDAAEATAEAPHAVEPGDYFTVELPKGLTLDLGDEPVKIFAPDEKGEPTEKVVAEATATEDGSLKVTFVEQEDESSSVDSDQTDNEQDQTDNNQGVTDNEQPGTENDQTVVDNDQTNQNTDQTGQETDNDQMVDQGDTTDEIMTLAGEDAKVAGTLTLSVKLASSAVEGETPSLAWNLGDSERTISLPARSEILEKLGNSEAGSGSDDETGSGSVGGESGEDPDGGADEPGGTVTTEPGSEVTANTQPADTTEAEGEEGSASLTVRWLDNNNADGKRPELSEVQDGYVLEFVVGDTHYAFDEKNAKEVLKWTDDQWKSFVTSDTAPGVTVEQVGSTYVARADGLPTELVTTTWAQKTDEETGKPVYGEDSETGEMVPVWASTITKKPIEWNIVDKNTYLDDEKNSQYQVTFDEANNVESLQLKKPSDFNIVGKVGFEDFKVMAEDTRNNLVVQVLVNGTPVKDEDGDNLEISLKEDQNWNSDFYDKDGNQYSLDKVWSIEDNATEGTLTITGPAYTLDNKTIEYRLVYKSGPKEDESAAGTFDYYEATVDNTDSSNHGGSTDELYAGGTMYFTHRGTTTFTAKKAWLDNNNEYETRKDTVTFTLVRYPYHGDGTTVDPQNAVQVTDESGNFVNLTLDLGEAGEKYLVQGSEDVYDLGKLLADRLGKSALEKYDPDGYPYIYALRESSQISGYRTVYGEVYDDGNSVDTAPNYKKADGVTTEYVDASANKEWERSGDVLLYNGGTLSNQIYDTVTVSATKEWNIASFADQLKDVVCTFTLQSRLADEGTDTDDNKTSGWRDADVNPNTIEVKGFGAEQLEKSFSTSAPLYDAQGRKLEYRWIETKVLLNSKEISIDYNQEELVDADRKLTELTGTFSLTLERTDGDKETEVTLPFFSRWEQGASHDDIGTKNADAISNYFQAETEQRVGKRWVGNDGEPLGEGDPEPEPIEIHLYRGFEKVATITLDGTGALDGDDVKWLDDDLKGFDEEKGQLERPTVTVDKDNPWQVSITDLPQYDDKGGAYSYRVFEGENNHWDSTLEYDEKEHVTTITNEPSTGISTSFHLMKEWVDDSDSSHHLVTHVRVSAATDIYASQTAQANGGTPLYTKDQLIYEDLVITPEQTWLTSFKVRGEGVKMDQLRIEETYLEDTATKVRYPVVKTREEAEKEYADNKNLDLWIDSAWGKEADDFPVNSNLPRVATNDHVYEVTVETRDADDESQANQTFGTDMFVVRNRRIGQVDLQIKKTWQDLGVDLGQDDNPRPEAYFYITCDDGQGFFGEATVGEGENAKTYATIRLTDGNVLPIYTDESRETRLEIGEGVGQAQLISGSEGRTQALMIAVNREANSGTEVTLGLYGLPKYNGKGEIVHYHVMEDWKNGESHGDYVIQENVLPADEAYVIKPLHFHDVQTVSFTNKRSATTSVTFYKQWNDYYVKDELAQRPDIRLSLYQVSEGSKTLSKTSGNPIFVWEAVSAPEGTDPNGPDGPKYNQKCTVSGLPKYDEKGAEITYYAQEHWVSDGTSLDYENVAFKAAEDASGPAPLYQLKEANVGESKPVDDVDDAYSGDNENATYALRQGGTFINGLSNTVTVRGTKRWVNTDDVIEDEHLPKLMLILQQRLKTDGEEWPGVKLVKETGGDGEVSYTPAPTNGNEPGGCIAWTTTFDAAWTYVMYHTGHNTGTSLSGEVPDGESRLPKYDKEGRLYEYRVVEVVVGLIDTGGGMSWEELKSSDNENESKDLNALNLQDKNDVFAVEDSKTGQYLITNTYDPAKGDLTVKKILTGLATDDTKLPEVEFTLYRRYQTGTSGDGAAVYTEWQQVPGSGNPGTLDNISKAEGATEAIGYYTFEDLDVYAPNGSKWEYRVDETALDAYPTVTAGPGDLESSSENLKEPKEITSGEEDAKKTVAWSLDGRITIEPNESGEQDEAEANSPDDPATPEPAPTADATFSNGYVPGDGLTLTGTKKWVDQNDAFGLRPQLGAENFTLVRYTEGNEADAETVTLSDEGTNKNFEWTKSDGAEWAFEITGLELWASDNKPWIYKITEKLADGQTDYVISGNGPAAKVDASTNSGSFSAITNSLAASAKVTKKWQPEDNSLNLRPKSVTVQLQARVQSEANGAWGNWGEANSVLESYAKTGSGDASGDPIAESRLKLNAGNGWSKTWSGLPAKVKDQTAEDTYYAVQYRVIETKVGGEGVRITTNGHESIGPNGENKITLAYGKVLSYTGEGVTTLSTKAAPKDNLTNTADASLSETAITNTLEGTSLKVKKVWQDDGNKWSTRPSYFDNTLTDHWYVDFYLQRSSDDGTDWEFVKDVDGNLVKKRMSSSDKDAGDGELTFTGLPQKVHGDSGKTYTYRAVEAVPGGYSVIDGAAISVSLEGVDGPLYTVEFDAVDGAAPDEGQEGDAQQPESDPTPSQTFTNSLNYINFSGKKAWDDFGTGLIPTDANGDGQLDATPTLVLERTTDEYDKIGGKTVWEKVVYEIAGEEALPQPTWGIDSTDTSGKTWTWSYDGLPQKDGEGNSYTYRVREAGSVPGFYVAQAVSVGKVDATQGAGSAVQDTGDANQGTHVQGGDQTGVKPLKNVATRFTFNKVNDVEENPAQVLDVELAVVDNSDNPETVYAIWRRGADGELESYVWQNGVSVDTLWPGAEGVSKGDWEAARASISAESSQGATVMADGNAGSIIGLEADNYAVIETGPVSTSEKGGSTVYHARLTPFTIGVGHTDANGDVSLVGSPDGASVAMDGEVAKITAEDPIFRGYFSFTKKLGSPQGEALGSVKFDLYYKGSGGDYVLIAEDLTTGRDGAFTSYGSNVKLSSYNPDDVTRATLADGLVPGSYKLVEQEGSIPDSVYWPSTGDAAFKTEFEFEITADDHDQNKAVKVGGNGRASGVVINPAFQATIKLRKYDSTSNEVIEGAIFKLERQTSDGANAWEVVDNKTTNKAEDGLVYTVDEKGTYRLTETDNTGYYLVDDIVFQFTVENEDYNKTFDFSKEGDRSSLGLTVTKPGAQLSDDEVSALLEDGLANDRLPGEVTFRKVDASLSETDAGYGITGAEFSLQKMGEGDEWDEDFATGLKTGYTYVYNQETGKTDGGAPNTGGVPSGTLKVTGLPWGTYRFVETAPAPGYENKSPKDALITSETFVIGADSKDENGNSIETVIGEEAISVTLPDVENNKTSISIIKKGTGTNDRLADATFQIKPTREGVDSFASINGVSAPKVIAVSTNDQGDAEIDQGLLRVNNTYTIFETTAPAGYECLEGEFTFTMREDGSIAVARSSVQATEGEVGYRIGSDLETIVVTDAPIDLLLQKQTKDGVPLKGVEFKITPQSDGGAFVDAWLQENDMTVDEDDGSVTVATNENGKLDLTGALVQNNVYTLEEAKAPEGYEAVDPLTFRVEPDGSLTVGVLDGEGNFSSSDSAELPEDYTLADAESGVLTLTAVDHPTGVRLKKLGVNDTALAGASFVLKPAAEGDSFVSAYDPGEDSGIEIVRDTTGSITSITVTSGEDGLTPDLTGALVTGCSYRVTESVVPDGYEPAGSAVITMGSDGSLTVVPEQGRKGEFEVDARDASVLVVRDAPIAITIHKTDYLGEKSLAGAQFKIVPAEGSSFVDVEMKEYLVTTGSDGMVSVAGVLRAENAYIISEVAPPAGYEVHPAGSSLTFTVNEDGTIKTDTASDAAPWFAIASADGEATIIEVKDVAISLGLKKLNVAGDPLSGAVFEVRGKFTDGSNSVRLDPTDENGLAAFPSAQLIAGEKYTIVEVLAPSGYKALSEFSFEVTDNGVIVAEPTSTGSAANGDLTAGYLVPGDGLTLVAVNELRTGGGGTPGDPDDKPDPDEPDPDEPGVDEPDPDEPTDPDDPDNPEDPDDPDSPDNPDNPEDPDDPDSPDNPDNPEDPDDPDSPDDPDDPEDPDDPGTPDDPSDPGDPDTPDDPSDPDDPGTPGHPGTPGTPDAGDHTNAALPGIVAMAGAALVACAAALMRRRGANNR